jgi:hypothetical protein
MDRIAATYSGRKEQKSFLEIRSQEDQIENLADAGAGHMSELSQLGVVADLAGTYQLVEAHGQSHEAADAGHTA